MDGIRRSKNVGNTTYDDYITQNGQVIRQSRYSINADSSKALIYTLDFIYESNGKPYALIYTPTNGTATTYYYVLDLQGDVVAMLNSTGSIVARYAYNAWGKLLSVTDANGAAITDPANIALVNPLRYRGYYYDAETGLYYLQSRYYDPAICRFISTDAADSAMAAEDIHDTNLFAYCGDNPVLREDKDGDSWWVFAGALVGGIVGLACQVTTNLATNQQWNQGIIGAFVGGAAYGLVATATFNTVAASYAGAAAESATNEAISYTSFASINGGQQKELTTDNISKSATKCIQDTMVNGTIAAATSKLAGKIVHTNNGWFRPKKFVSSFFGKYARKSAAQTAVQSIGNSIWHTIRYYGVRFFTRLGCH